MYTTTHNPCRADLSVNPSGCVQANWTPNPGDLASVGAIRVDFGSLVLDPNDSISFTWRVATPINAPVGAVAWNSFGYVATRLDNGQLLESAEPPKVGLQVEGPGPGPCCTPGIPDTGADSDVAVVPGGRADPGWRRAHAVPAPALNAGSGGLAPLRRRGGQDGQERPADRPVGRSAVLRAVVEDERQRHRRHQEEG